MSNWPQVPGYEQLEAVLRAAYNQASSGKGADRHANGLPFHEQRMQSISDLLVSERGMAFQVMKKVAEGLDLPTDEAVERELLGAIVYTAGIIIWRRRHQALTELADGQGFGASTEVIRGQ